MSSRLPFVCKPLEIVKSVGGEIHLGADRPWNDYIIVSLPGINRLTIRGLSYVPKDIYP